MPAKSNSCFALINQSQHTGAVLKWKEYDTAVNGPRARQSLKSAKRRRESRGQQETLDISTIIFQKACGGLCSQLEGESKVTETDIELSGHQTKHHVALHVVINIPRGMMVPLCSRLVRVEGKSECSEIHRNPGEI